MHGITAGDLGMRSGIKYRMLLVIDTSVKRETLFKKRHIYTKEINIKIKKI